MRRGLFLLRSIVLAGFFLFASIQANAQLGNALRRAKQAATNAVVNTVKESADKMEQKANYKKLPEEGKWCIEQLRHPEGMPATPWCMKATEKTGAYIANLGTANEQEVESLKKEIDARHKSNLQIIKARRSIEGKFDAVCADADAVSAAYFGICEEEHYLRVFRGMLEKAISYESEKINVSADGNGDFRIQGGSALQIIGVPMIKVNTTGEKASFYSDDKTAYAEPSQVEKVKSEIKRFANIATLLDANVPAERSTSFFKAHAASMMAAEAIATNDIKNKRPNTKLVTEREVVSTPPPSTKRHSANVQTFEQKKVKEYRIEKGSARGYVTSDGVIYDWAHRKLGSLPAKDGDIKNATGSTIGKIWNGEIKDRNGQFICKVSSGGSISEPGSNATVGEVNGSGAVKRKGKELGRVSGVSYVWAVAIVYCNFFNF